MFTKIKNRMESEEGFTLIELLVVILIIGILAAIAIPSFLNQRIKGQDACATSMVKQMQTAIKTAQIDSGNYNNISIASLTAIESSIQPNACGAGSAITVAGAPVAAGAACVGATTGTANGFCVGASSASGTSFALSETAAGVTTRSCSVAGTGGCKGPAGSW